MPLLGLRMLLTGDGAVILDLVGHEFCTAVAAFDNRDESVYSICK